VSYDFRDRRLLSEAWPQILAAEGSREKAIEALARNLDAGRIRHVVVSAKDTDGRQVSPIPGDRTFSWRACRFDPERETVSGRGRYRRPGRSGTYVDTITLCPPIYVEGEDIDRLWPRQKVRSAAAVSIAPATRGQIEQAIDHLNAPERKGKLTRNGQERSVKEAFPEWADHIRDEQWRDTIRPACPVKLGRPRKPDLQKSGA
jgi:hypothetical protein